MALAGQRLLGGRRSGRCVSGDNRTASRARATTGTSFVNIDLVSKGRSRMLKRAYYDWIRAAQVPYDRNVCCAFDARILLKNKK